MSVNRELNVPYDADTLQEVARELGLRTSRNTCPIDYFGKKLTKADIVIHPKNGGYDIGFTELADGTTTLNGDFHGGHAEKMLKEVLPRWVERTVAKSKSKRKAKNLGTVTVKGKQLVRMYIGV